MINKEITDQINQLLNNGFSFGEHKTKKERDEIEQELLDWYGKNGFGAFLEEGADLVIFSGGKAICGPNDSGILCGRGDLIEAATAQAFPNPGIGRALKVSKEQIVGLVYALRRFAKTDFDAEAVRWQDQCQRMCDGLQGLTCARAEIAMASGGARPLMIPRVRVVVDVDALGKTLEQIDEELERGTPAMAVVMQPHANELWLSPQHLQEGEAEVSAARLRHVLMPT